MIRCGYFTINATEPEISLFVFYSTHSSPLLKPGAYIIHNATQPLTVQSVTQVCNASQAASLQQRQGAGYRGLVSLLVCNFSPPDFFW